jgi:hypothetical protein
MPYRALADAVVLVHGAFILFVVLGGFGVLRWPRLAWVHLPCAAYGVWVELADRICPLTPLENALRRVGGEIAYDASFVEHYIVPLIYPGDLTRSLQLWLAGVVLASNAIAYGWVWRRRRSVARD